MDRIQIHNTLPALRKLWQQDIEKQNKLMFGMGAAFALTAGIVGIVLFKKHMKKSESMAVLSGREKEINKNSPDNAPIDSEKQEISPLAEKTIEQE